MLGLQLGEVRLAGARPHIHVRKQLAKGGRARVVPLWWDSRTLAALNAWLAERVAQGAVPESLVVGPRQAERSDRPLSRHTLRKHFKTACKILGQQRLRQLTIHHGRHTFVSLALASGRSLPQVRDAAGHTNISTTSCYLHVTVDDQVGGRDLI